MPPSSCHLEVRELSLALLHEHEQIERERLREILQEIKREGRLREPILVDRDFGVILDGHHRFHAYQALGFQMIPCVLVDYNSEVIEVRSRRSEISVSKAEVIRRALSGELYPPKTTQHILHAEVPGG